MQYIYSRWKPESPTDEQRLEKLLTFFSYLLLQTNGDVNETLEWIKQLDEKYNIFDSTLTFELFLGELLKKGLIEETDGTFLLTQKGELRIRKDSFMEIFGNLKRDSQGLHETLQSGRGVERTNFTKKYKFGDQPNNIDATQTLTNVYIRDGIEEFNLCEEDIELYETEQQVNCATVLLVDISHSMVLYGEDRITPAKQVALALSELILSKYKKDTLKIVLFGDEAKEVSVKELPYITAGPYHTNTKAGLEMARHLLRKIKNSNKQIFLITDGKPSAIYDPPGSKFIYKNSFGLDSKIVNKTLDEANSCRKEKIRITTFMLAQDPYLKNFINDFTEACNGKAFYSSLDDLGNQIFVNYFRSKNQFSFD